MLEDVLTEGLAVVFCGTSVAEKSGRTEAYYAARGNKFWGVLFRTKLTPRQLRPEEYSLLLAHDIGLADLTKARPGTETAPAKDDHAVQDFRKKVAENKPSIVAFNGKDAAKRCLALESVPYGRRKTTFENAIVYVLPSTSSMAHEHWDDEHWNLLAAEVRKLRNAR